MKVTCVRDPQAEAADLLGRGRGARVLEPSPPAINEGPWFADDPTAVGTRLGKERIIVPTDDGEMDWAEATAGDPVLEEFAREHWLGHFKRLEAPPAHLANTRDALRDLAFNVLSPARQASNGKIALRWTRGGFGTPFFGNDEQLRVEGTNLIRQVDGHVYRVPITSLRDAADFVGVTPGPPTGLEFHDPPPTPDFDAILDVDAARVAYLDDWFGFATLVLERLRARAGRPDDTRVQLWTEHFDPAIELGNADKGSRASFGASPGDAGITVPYLYVSPWAPQTGPFWDAPFGGAALSIEQLIGSRDQVREAVDFFEFGRALLAEADQAKA